MAPITNPLLRSDLRAMVETKGAGPDTFISLLINRIFMILLVIAVLIFIFFFIQGAYKIILSEGDKSKLEEGRKAITSAILGLVIIFLLFAILKLIGYIFGIPGLESLTLTWPTL